MKLPSRLSYLLQLLLTTLLAVTSQLRADDDGSETEDTEASEESNEESPNPSERISRIMSGYQEHMRTAFKSIAAAKTDEARAKIKLPDHRPAVRAVVRILKEYPDDPVAPKALQWSVQLGVREPDIFPELESLIEKHYLDLDGLEDVCLSLSYLGSDVASGLLLKISEGSTNTNARAASLFALGAIEANEGNLKEAERYFIEVTRDFADATVRGRSIAEQANGQLFEIRNLSVGRVAPEIEGEMVDGTPFKLSEHLGEVVVLNFFGHWCGPCRAMYPHERSLLENLKDEPFSLIGINSDPKSVLEKIIEDGTVTWECVWDGGDTHGPIASKWNVRAWPTIYILDQSGVIRFKGLRGEAMENAVLKLLAEKKNVSK